MKKAICVGINNYSGTANNLNGCVNDANDWANLLESFGFQTSTILDEQATMENLLNAFSNLINNASEGDVVVFTYSGHGTTVLDTSGDEPDSYDEALFVFDGPIIDDKFRVILDNANKGAQIIIISDSCFSGTVTRALSIESAKPRFIKTDTIPASAILKKHFLAKTSDENMVELLLSGCNDSEYSYDAYINGKWNGAMTANAISVIKPEQTYNEFFTKLRTILPSKEYPQTPQLEGSEANKNNLIFTKKSDDNQGNGEVFNNAGASNSSGCLSILISIMTITVVVLTVILTIAL